MELPQQCLGTRDGAESPDVPDPIALSLSAVGQGGCDLTLAEVFRAAGNFRAPGLWQELEVPERGRNFPKVTQQVSTTDRAEPHVV